MASTTPNIGLTLPTGAEKVSRQIINDNNTIIDGKMGAVPGGQNLQGEIDALNSNLSISEGTVTNVVTPTRSDVFKCYKTGHVVQVFINNVSYGSSFSTDTEIATLQFPPIALTRFLILQANGTILSGFVNQNNSRISINGYTSGQLLYGSFVYLTNS